MGSITCATGDHSFDVPQHLANAAMALHQRTLHGQVPRRCEHDWGPAEFFGQSAAEVRCLLCGRYKLVVRRVRYSWQ